MTIQTLGVPIVVRRKQGRRREPADDLHGCESSSRSSQKELTETVRVALETLDLPSLRSHLVQVRVGWFAEDSVFPGRRTMMGGAAATREQAERDEKQWK